MIKVVAAVLVNSNSEVLLAQRPEGKVFSGFWEFPGGKIEAGESPRDALSRELSEEIGIKIENSREWISRTHQYPHGTVNIQFFRVTDWSGVPRGREGQTLSWESPQKIGVEPLLGPNVCILKALTLKDEYLITNATEFGVPNFLEQLRRVTSSGDRLIQIREKGLVGSELKEFCEQAISIIRVREDNIVLVNDDVALARSVRADGVHFTSNSLRRLGKRPDIGWCAASCHNIDDLKKASSLGLDFVVLSPVKTTLSHPDANPLGWDQFSHMANYSNVPVYALGGMVPSDLSDAWKSGAAGVSLMRSAWS